MKENVKSVVVLTAICLVVAALLAVTNFYTAPVIEAKIRAYANEPGCFTSDGKTNLKILKAQIAENPVEANDAVPGKVLSFDKKIDFFRLK